ncbi:hypothetical protein [Nitrospirillum iridis]|uniref:Uncharacterized protein n=1 Tax=Nitrospirillum iridis TaxID=765888 RepID=A0A7X0ASY4_9PROT|nr:hypothetical protein [Nitrospirillum iridis]MBB6249517.1 hypothetical protein [Nitrospirillum iridis]
MPVTIVDSKLSPSNKPLTLSLSKIAYSGTLPTGGTFRVLKPFIDKMTLLIDVPLALQDEVVEGAKILCQSGAGFQWVSNAKSRYQVRLFAKIPGSRHKIIVEVKPKDASKIKSFIRVEMNPQKASDAGLKVLREMFLVMFLNAPQALSEAIDNARVSRLDITVDILGVDIKDALVHPIKAQKTLKKKILYMAPSGAVQTIYAIFTKNGSGNWCAYNKKLQATEKKKSYHYHDVDCLRIEKRKDPKMHLKNISKMENPFGEVSVYLAGLYPPNLHGDVWPLFLDSCRMRGPQNALALIQDEVIRQSFSQCLMEAGAFWDAGKLWGSWADISAQLIQGLKDQ